MCIRDRGTHRQETALRLAAGPGETIAQKMSGFLTVRTQAMPVFTRMMEETGDSNLALLQTLLHLMAWNDDTNLVSVSYTHLDVYKRQNRDWWASRRTTSVMATVMNSSVN